MPTVHAPDNVREEAKPLIKLFTDNPDLKMKIDKKAFSIAEFTALDAAVKAADEAVEAKRAELTPLLNARNEKAAELNTVVVQARKAVAGFFGEDSDEYELAGGTRKSERKTGLRRAKAPTATDTSKK